MSLRTREWLMQTELRCKAARMWYPNLSGTNETLYMGRPISDEWPTKEMMDADFLRWEREDSGRLDTADPKTFEGWVQCADGRTLWEYAKDGGKK